jgi:hypothetical protein
MEVPAAGEDAYVFEGARRLTIKKTCLAFAT